MIRDDGNQNNGMRFFSITFDESGSTSVKARTAEEAVSLGKQFFQNGRTNVRIATPGAKTFALAEFEAALARRKTHQ
jgi:hypothetical protein